MHKLWLSAGVALLGVNAAPAAEPSLTVPLSSNERVGLNVSSNDCGASVSAAFGLWSDDGALELSGFQDRADPSIARVAELVSGKPMQTRGLRMRGSLYRGGGEARGWSLGVEAKRQQLTDIGAALSGAWRRSSDSRLSVSGKLKF